MRTGRGWVLLLGALIAVGCAGDDAEDEDLVADSAVVSGDSVAQAPLQPVGMAKDRQHEYLRSMTDHHEGLVQLGGIAMSSASTNTAQQDAHMLHEKQTAERDSMVQMIQRLYQEQHAPRAMPKNLMQADSLSRLSGPEYDRTFYRMVIDHHREGIRMIDQHLGQLTDPAVRQMAERMKADQQREITGLEKKARPAGG